VHNVAASHERITPRTDVTAPRKRSTGGTFRLQNIVRLSAAGAGMLLGDLEHRVLEAAWAEKRPATARELFKHVTRTHEVVYITCVTVANRLVEKGILHRAKLDDVYHYTATLTKAESCRPTTGHAGQLGGRRLARRCTGGAGPGATR
jgi:hypothetical protein